MPVLRGWVGPTTWTANAAKVPYKNHFDAYLAVLRKSTNDLQTRSFAMAQRYGHGSKKSIIRHQSTLFSLGSGIFGIQPVLPMSISLSGRFGQETIRTMRRRSQKCCWQSRSISSLELRPFSGMVKNCVFFGVRRPHGFWMKNPAELFF